MEPSSVFLGVLLKLIPLRQYICDWREWRKYKDQRDLELRRRHIENARAHLTVVTEALRVLVDACATKEDLGCIRRQILQIVEDLNTT